MVNYVCAKTVPDFTKLHLIKGPKIKISWGACLQTPLVCHILCIRMHTPLPNNLYNLILPPIQQISERNLDFCSVYKLGAQI